ncbi:MAG: aminotransferase class I/II-fold pyridoxal phosphate-dependent enzyme [Acidobacteriota bacterium]
MSDPSTPLPTESSHPAEDQTGSKHPLELSEQALRDMVDGAVEHLVEHLRTLPEQPMSYSDGAVELAASLREELPEAGQPFAELLELIFERALNLSYNTASPGYLAYIPGGGLPHAGVADLIADTVNRYIGVFIACPGLVQLEINVTRWMCDIVGYGPDSQGLLTTGGSMANFTGIYTARREKLPDDFLNGTLYCSDQVHHSITKAAMLAGFPPINIRTIPSDDSYRMPIDALAQAIENDRQGGMKPFLIVASAGTVNTGAVDDLEAIADLAADERLWFHVDGAYGGFFALTERGRARLSGLDRSDSISLDPHKGLFLPYGTGCLVVRDGSALKRAHHVVADYMPSLQDDPELIDFSECSPELSRDFRGLRVWLPIKMHGIGAFRQALDEKLDLAAWACRELATIPNIEIVAAPQLSIVAFRLVPPGIDEEGLEQLTRELRDRINARQRVLLTPTWLDGRYVIRICVLNFRTHLGRLELCLEDIRAAAGEVFERLR